ncbi:centromere protein K-like [Dipodomys merriami]|uniref:centromere protein K-like n=1 Tax=Dipodomys merriami TaxID=94247 RepID=UPI0038556868
MWKDIEECQKKWTLVGTETLSQMLSSEDMILKQYHQSKNEELKEDLEQQWLDEQQQIMESFNEFHSGLKNQIVTFSESRILNELQTKMLNRKEVKDKLLSIYIFLC